MPTTKNKVWVFSVQVDLTTFFLLCVKPIISFVRAMFECSFDFDGWKERSFISMKHLSPW